MHLSYSDPSVGGTAFRNFCISLLVGGVFLPGCSCTPEKEDPISLGRGRSGQGGEGIGEGAGDGNGGMGRGTGAESGDGSGDGAGDGSGSGNDSGVEGTQGSGKSVVGENETSSKGGAAAGQEAAAAQNDGVGDDSGVNRAAKDGSGTSTVPEKKPAILPGRPPEAPRYTAAEAVAVADRSLKAARRAKAGGDLAAAYQSATEAYAAVAPHAESNTACKKKADQASRLLEALAKQQPPPSDPAKPTVFQ